VDAATVDELAHRLQTAAGLPGPVRREPIRAWALSGVERLRLPDGATVIYKYAARPFTHEAATLRHVARHGVPVPRVIAADEHAGTLGMLLEDLGDPDRDPTLDEAAAAAVATHHAPVLDGVPVLDTDALTALPAKSLASMAQLERAGRWAGVDGIVDRLTALQKLAAQRVAGAETPPYGLCHSEFHPTSLHVTGGRWRLLDWARAFHGPGLLDLASWQNTSEAPDLDAYGHLLDAYLAVGGARQAAETRGGLDPARWAYGWHRLWVVEWYLEQATTWIARPASDPTYQRVVRRHLDEALTCLDSTTSA
jgi:hypothetical protein